MSFDSEGLYAPIYAGLGVDGVLALGSAGSFDFRIIDKTTGEEAEDGGGIGMHRLVPAARIRYPQLTSHGLTPEDVDGGIATFNSRSWKVESHSLKPAPTGEGDGEVVLYLSAAGASA